jgi:hypothetical protein
MHPKYVLQEFLGHKSTKLTLDWYSHSMPRWAALLLTGRMRRWVATPLTGE